MLNRLKEFIKGSGNPHLARGYLAARQMANASRAGKITFVTLNDVALWMESFCREIPNSYDVIVGLPRSGFIVAAPIALRFGRPLADPDTLLQGGVWQSKDMDFSMDSVKRVLLVEDTTNTAQGFVDAEENLRSRYSDLKIDRASLIVSPESADRVQFFHQTIPQPRLFEWNLMHARRGVIGVDMDGVLCKDCPEGLGAGDVEYEHWLPRAQPYLIPHFEIDYVVTSRLEMYQTATEQWLAEHGVRYKELHMWNLPSTDKALRAGKHAEYKIDTLLRLKPEFYWESSLWQAEKIFMQTRIPTLCIDEMVLLS